MVCNHFELCTCYVTWCCSTTEHVASVLGMCIILVSGGSLQLLHMLVTDMACFGAQTHVQQLFLLSLEGHAAGSQAVSYS